MDGSNTSDVPPSLSLDLENSSISGIICDIMTPMDWTISAFFVEHLVDQFTTVLLRIGRLELYIIDSLGSRTIADRLEFSNAC